MLWRRIGRPSEVTMLRVKHTIGAFMLAFGAGLLGAGCADNDSTLFIEGVLSLTATDCVARPDAEAVFLVGGTLDRAFARHYLAAIQVGNQLTQQGNREKLRTETSRLHLEGAKVTVFGTDGSSASFTSAATGFAHPAAGTDPGLAAMFVELVRQQDIPNLGPDGQFIVRFRAFGTTLGGQEIESGDYEYPVRLCEGCLVTYPISSRDPTQTDYICDVKAENAEESKICLFGQDQSIPCTECAAFSDICLDPSLNGSVN